MEQNLKSIVLGSWDSELAAKIQARFTRSVKSPIKAVPSKFSDWVIIENCQIRRHASLVLNFEDVFDFNLIKIRLGESGLSRKFLRSFRHFRISCDCILFFMIQSHGLVLSRWFLIETWFQSSEYTNFSGFRIGSEESENYTRFELIYILLLLPGCADGNSCFYFWCWLLNYKSSIIQLIVINFSHEFFSPSLVVELSSEGSFHHYNYWVNCRLKVPFIITTTGR